MLVKKPAEDVDLDIVGTTLLSIEEAEQLPPKLLEYDNWWWLRSPGGDSHHAARVYYDGTVDYRGYYVDRSDGAVRLALQIKNLESSNLKIGDTLMFGEKEFEIISDSLALCSSDIGKCAFRKNWEATDADDYEKSDIKKYVDDWFNKYVKENNYPCKYFDEREEKVYLTDFEKGVLFARTGKHIEYIYKTVGRCRGTKDMEMCNCDGDRSKCDFH